MGTGILNRGTQVHKSKVKYNRLAIAKKFDCNVVKYKTEEQQKSQLDPFCDHCGRQTHHIYVHGHYQCNDCKVVTDPCCSGDQNKNKVYSTKLKESQVPKKLKIKLKRQASEKGLVANQVEKYIQKVERQMNRRKSD